MEHLLKRWLTFAVMAAVLALQGCGSSSGDNGQDVQDDTMDVNQDGDSDVPVDMADDTGDGDTVSDDMEPDETTDAEDEDMDLPPPGCSAACELDQPPAGDLTCYTDDTNVICAVDCSNETDYDDCNGFPEDGCEKMLTTISDCGACGNSCADVSNGTPVCTDGSCSFECNMGWGDCDGDPSNGCETDLNNDAAHCGMCDNACTVMNGAAVCDTGTCAIDSCDMGFDDCDTDYANGCEQELNTLTHCGACNTACTVTNGSGDCSTQVCEVGSCDPGYVDANADVSDGCEATITANTQLDYDANINQSTTLHLGYFDDNEERIVLAWQTGSLLNLPLIDHFSIVTLANKMANTYDDTNFLGGPVHVARGDVYGDNAHLIVGGGPFGGLGEETFGGALTTGTGFFPTFYHQFTANIMGDVLTFSNPRGSSASNDDNIIVGVSASGVYVASVALDQYALNPAASCTPTGFLNTYELCNIVNSTSSEPRGRQVDLMLMDSNSTMFYDRRMLIIGVPGKGIEGVRLSFRDTYASYTDLTILGATMADTMAFPEFSNDMVDLAVLQRDPTTDPGFVTVGDNIKVFRFIQTNAASDPTAYSLEAEIPAPTGETVVEVEVINSTTFLVATDDAVYVAHSSPTEPLYKLEPVITGGNSHFGEIEYEIDNGRLLLIVDDTVEAYTFSL